MIGKTMVYNEVIKLLTPEFLKRCCELSIDYKGGHMVFYKKIDTMNTFYTSINFGSLLIQAWIGYNEQHVYNQINYKNKEFYFRFERCKYTYTVNYFESDFPLPRFFQALIAILAKAIEIIEYNKTINDRFIPVDKINSILQVPGITAYAIVSYYACLPGKENYARH